ncbi:hypothetical protein ACFLTB_05950, partial [Chloroflexota bacterium]
LNGYPVVNYSIKDTRKIVESCDAAFSLRAGPVEFGIASGMTSCGAGGVAFRGMGTGRGRSVTPEESILNSQYSMRISGWYADRGVTLTSDPHGWQPNGPIPLSVCIASMIISILGSAEQGHRSATPLVFCLGNMVQDLAWIRLEPKLIREYLDKFGYKDFIISGVIPTQIPLFPVPSDWGGAFAYLCYTAMVGSLSKSPAVDLRSADEGAGIPTEEVHKMSWRAAKWIFDVVREQKIEIDVKGIEEEEKVTEIEVRAMIDKVLELGDGDILIGAAKAVEAGVLDSPWGPSLAVKDQVLAVRDARGAWRYLEFGNLPIPNEIKEFHREKIAERERLEGKKVDYYTAVRDFLAFSKGKIVGLPPYDK